MCVLKADNLTVKMGSAELVKNINLALNAGEIHAVVGPNGAGKSTLLNAITGDLPLHAGSLSLCGKSANWSIQERARSVAVLPQLSLLNFPYTVSEVVSLGRTPHSTGYKLDGDIVKQAMYAMDIANLSDRLYTQLSGGEKQRTQLARVMAQIWREQDATMRLLLLDEPTSALDLGHQQQLMDAVKRFAGNGVGILMVVHDINIAAKYADQVLALSGGKTLAQGTTESVLTEPLLQTLFNADVRIVQHPQTHKIHVLS